VVAVGSEGGAPEVVVEALGVPVGIPVSGSAAARLRHQWSRALTDRAATTVVDVDLVDSVDDAAHDYAITTRVTLAALDATAGRRINLHAGAVADEQGRTLAVIGPSGSGKTTAVTLLARRLGYLSDETVSLDEDLRVHGHPKPLSVITDTGAPRSKQSLSPDELGLRHPPERAYLHRIVLLHRGHGDAGLVPVPAPRAIAAMVEQTSSLVRLTHPVHRLATAIDACGGAWGLEYTEFEDRLDDMVGLLDAEPQEAAARVHHPGSSLPTGDPVAGAWSRAPWTDAEEYADELVLMVGDRVHVLAGLGVVIWLALDSPRTTDELVAEAQATWGEHPDAAALVTDALAVMVGQRMVQPPA
jgi:energy-coupling factor transporter ATP-binding protein EcfA2